MLGFEFLFLLILN